MENILSLDLTGNLKYCKLLHVVLVHQQYLDLVPNF